MMSPALFAGRSDGWYQFSGRRGRYACFDRLGGQLQAHTVHCTAVSSSSRSGREGGERQRTAWERGPANWRGGKTREEAWRAERRRMEEKSEEDDGGMGERCE